MLTQSSVSSIYSLANIAEQNSVVILPHGDTPLAVLNSSVGLLKKTDNIEVALVAASETHDVLGDKEHSQAIDELVDIASAAVQRQLKFSRENVGPVAGDVFEQVSKYLDDTPISELRHSINEVVVPAVLNVPAIQDMVDRFKSQPQVELKPLGSVLPVMSSEQLLERVKTGMGSVDKELNKLIEANAGIVERVYEEYFLGKETSVRSGSYLAEEVVCFVLARNLNTNVPDGVNLELTAYRALTSHFVAEFGRRIFQTLRRQDRILRQKQIINFMPPADSVGAEIHVNSVVYQQFLKEGGTPEAIIGACLRGITNPNYADLLEDAYGGTKAVLANERVLQSRVVNEYEANVHAGIIEVLGKLIKADELPEDLPKVTVGDVRDWLTVHPFRKKFDLDLFCLRAVCGVIFPAYNAYPVLSGIMEYKANDATLSNREAATLVTIDLVGEWLSAQLTTERL